VGAITDVVRRYVPGSYRAMVTVTNSYYGISDLQALASFVQQRIFATVANEPDEASVYGVEKTELLGMLTTLQFIPAAVDYWGDQLASETTTGTSESVSYFDRRDQLWKLFDHLQKDAQQLAIDIGVPVNSAKAIVPKVSYADGGRNILTTPDPATWPKMRRGSCYGLPWATPVDP
jgi:hypothetical protein